LVSQWQGDYALNEGLCDQEMVNNKNVLFKYDISAQHPPKNVEITVGGGRLKTSTSILDLQCRRETFSDFMTKTLGVDTQCDKVTVFSHKVSERAGECSRHSA
jgi:hypothetical protein